jgi:hypothetical protein
VPRQPLLFDKNRYCWLKPGMTEFTTKYPKKGKSEP